LQNFIQLYKSFLHTQGKFLIQNKKVDHSLFNTFFQDIYDLFNFVENAGGFEEVTSQNLWHSQDLIFIDIVSASQLKSLKEFYEHYLFHFEKFCSKKVPSIQLENHEKKIEKLDPSLLEEIPIFVQNSNFNIRDDGFIKDIITNNFFIIYCFSFF